MDIRKICLIICLAVYSTTSAYATEKSDSLYKIKKIKTVGDYYVIHAQRNDSLFKIISKKVAQEKRPDLALLRKGEYYHFDFGKQGKEDTAKNGVEPLSGRISDLHVKNNYVFVDGNTKIRFTKRFHYRLYTTRNLIGLYYSP